MRRPAEKNERGAILLVVLILAVTFSLLGIALTSTVEVAVRARNNADELARAERAAVSGIEWAAAAVMTSGLIDGGRTFALDGGTQAAVTIVVGRSPQVLSAGRCNGAEITVGADLQLATGGALPFAYASFSTQSRFDHAVTINGSAYFDDSARPIASGLVPLTMAGDLFLVTSTALPGGAVTHTSGINRYGVGNLADPGVDTGPYEALTGSDVYRYSGTTEIANRTVNGIVIVSLDLGLGQYLSIRDATINGTIIVKGLLPALPLLGLTTPEIRIAGATVINGGTSRTGNVAILAPDADLRSPSATGATINGTTIVRQGTNLANITFRGQLVTMRGMDATNGPYTIDRPIDFRPDVPLGVDWPGPASVRIVWRGRQ